MTKIIEKPNADEERTTFTPGRPCRFTVNGYVIWSSTSCGLRPDQSVKTITWLSLRSGMASIGACSIAHSPQAAMPIQSVTTRNRLRIETSISRSIMDDSQVVAVDDSERYSVWVLWRRDRSCEDRQLPNARERIPRHRQPRAKFREPSFSRACDGICQRGIRRILREAHRPVY